MHIQDYTGKKNDSNCSKEEKGEWREGWTGRVIKDELQHNSMSQDKASKLETQSPNAYDMSTSGPVKDVWDPNLRYSVECFINDRKEKS